MFDIVLPGTGGMMPLPNRYLTCCFASFEKGAVLIDCGEGTQVALKKADCKISKIDLLLITHFHADHVAGLPGLMLTLGNCGKTTPLTVVGPRGCEYIARSLLVIAPTLPFELNFIELPNMAGCFTHSFDRNFQVEVEYLPLRHGTPCFAFALTLHRKPVFSPEKAEALCIPKPMYKILHSGRTLTLEDGRVIQPEQVLDGVRTPLKLCYCTDTLPFPEIAGIAKGADLFVSEGMYGDESERRSLSGKKHMMFRDSAEIALAAGVKRMWLTHYSPAMPNAGEYISVARAIFKESYAAYDGLSCTLPYEK